MAGPALDSAMTTGAGRHRSTGRTRRCGSASCVVARSGRQIPTVATTHGATRSIASCRTRSGEAPHPTPQATRHAASASCGLPHPWLPPRTVPTRSGQQPVPHPPCRSTRPYGTGQEDERGRQLRVRSSASRGCTSMGALSESALHRYEVDAAQLCAAMRRMSRILHPSSRRVGGVDGREPWGSSSSRASPPRLRSQTARPCGRVRPTGPVGRGRPWKGHTSMRGERIIEKRCRCSYGGCRATPENTCYCPCHTEGRYGCHGCKCKIKEHHTR